MLSAMVEENTVCYGRLGRKGPREDDTSTELGKRGRRGGGGYTRSRISGERNCNVNTFGQLLVIPYELKRQSQEVVRDKA